MEFTKSLIKGKLIKRYKRFFVDVKLNVKIHSLCTWKDIISVLEKRNTFNQTDIENLKEFLSRPEDWRAKNA